MEETVAFMNVCVHSGHYAHVTSRFQDLHHYSIDLSYDYFNLWFNVYNLLFVCIQSFLLKNEISKIEVMNATKNYVIILLYL